jgi:hypothetical protein
MKKIKDIGKKRKRLGAIFDIRLLMKYALDADNPESYNRRLAELKDLVSTMEMA